MKSKKTFKKFLKCILQTTKSAEQKLQTSTNKDDKIIFQLAQDNIYPLPQPLRELINIYNEQQKGTIDFLPVEIQGSDIVKQTTECGLAAQVATNLEAIKDEINPSYDKIPDIILGSQTGAFLINKYQKLLDLSKSEINKSLFDEDIYDLHNKIPGQSVEKIYSIPFNVTTLDGLVFNTDIMKLIFDQIQNGCGTIDQNCSVYKETKKTTAKEKTEIPKNKIWKYMIVKDSNDFKNFVVNDATFASYDKITEFSKKVFDGLKLDETKISNEIKLKLSKERDPIVLTVDYISNFFQKHLYNELKANVGNSIFGSPENFLWSLTKNNETGKNNIVYNYENTYKKGEFNKILKDNFDNFIKNNAQKDLLIPGTSPIKFKSIYYCLNESIDWASRDVKNYNAAFAIAPIVGTKKAPLDPFTAPAFEKNDPRIYKNYVKAKYLLWQNQVTKFNSTSSKGVFHEGGSSLIAISTTKKRGRATIKFITWFFKGSLNQNGKKVTAIDFLSEKCSYIIPTKDRVSFYKYKELTSKYNELNKSIESLNTKAKKTEEENETLLSLEIQASILEGALLSLGDLLLMKGIDLKTGFQDESKRIPIMFVSNDSKTSKFMQEIKNALIDNTNTIPKGTIKTGTQLVAKINP